MWVIAVAGTVWIAEEIIFDEPAAGMLEADNAMATNCPCTAQAIALLALHGSRVSALGGTVPKMFLSGDFIVAQCAEREAKS